jgi:hypothetical protein
MFIKSSGSASGVDVYVYAGVQAEPGLHARVFVPVFGWLTWRWCECWLLACLAISLLDSLTGTGEVARPRLENR